MTVFESFPKAIESNIWSICKIARQTEYGTTVSSSTNIDVIVDEAIGGSIFTSPNAESITNDILLYAKPNQLPTLKVGELMSSYIWKNAETEEYFKITNCGIGKNQADGSVEHVEFQLEEIELADVS